MDATWVEDKKELKKDYAKYPNEPHSNLRLGEFDYTPISSFSIVPLIDLCLNKVNVRKAYSFPSPALIGQFNNTAKTIIQHRVLIDYVLASPSLAKFCTKAQAFNKDDTVMLYDHYPVMVEFDFK